MNRLPLYGLIISLIITLASCGSANNFHKSSRLKKVRVNNKSVHEEISEESKFTFETELEEESTADLTQDVSENIDQIEEGIEEPIVEETVETEKSKKTFAERVKEIEPTSTQKFKNNHYATLSTYLAGLLFASIGYIYWSAIPYILGFCLLVGALVLATIMKYKISPEEADTSGKKYKKRMWLMNFVFYSCMLVVVLTLLAFLVILI